MNDNSMNDITGAKLVEIEIRDDGKVLWVHVNGQTETRICSIETLKITDHRPNQEPSSTVDFSTVAAPSEPSQNAPSSEPVAPRYPSDTVDIMPVDSAGWRFLLTLPVGWRPALDQYHANMVEGVALDQFKVDTNGAVWLHPQASELAVRWAVYSIYDAPKEVLGL